MSIHPNCGSLAKVFPMATFSDGIPASRPGLLGALRASLPRNEFFAGLYILGCVNGLLGRFLLSFASDGLIGALLSINVIILLACFAGISLLYSAERKAIQSLDFVVAAIFLICVCLPIFALSWVAVAGLSCYILIAKEEDAKFKRGAWIMLALTVPLLWARLVFQFLAEPILEMDSILVSSVLGTERVGNLVGFGDKSGNVLILPACSSFTNMSMAFLCWVTVTQWANHRWSPIDIWWSLFACAAVVAVNVTRMSLAAWSQGNYAVIHSAWGAEVFNYIIIAVTVAICVLGTRRELFSRA
jgi:hypothetical protein